MKSIISSRISQGLLPLLLPLVTACGSPTTVVQAPAAPANVVEGVVVTGQGEASAAPDLARINLGVEVRSEDVQAGLRLANQHMEQVITALKQQGIAAEDIRTQQFSVHFEQPPQHPPEPPPQPMPRQRSGAAAPAAPDAPRDAMISDKVAGHYRIANTVEAKVRDLDRLSQILGAATAAGANNVWGIGFEMDDPKPLLAKARAEAVQDARRSAEELASLTGVQLGPVISVNETGGHVPVNQVAMRMDKAEYAVPVERGQISVQHQVQIVYSIARAR
ncbi:MAG TPA: SIMPL domain-containing protein [Polyangiaceae bacterium]|nr:SIMPL domain-containing protein [Polyangiaceae bacterium]